MMEFTTEQCIEYLRNYKRQQEIDRQFKELPEEVQENAKQVLNELLSQPPAEKGANQ